MGKKGTPGTCRLCGRQEEKEGFIFGAARYLYYCIAPLCEIKGVPICSDCWKRISPKHYKEDKCPKCDFGHMKKKDDWQ
jgi:DNA-directed RNA polymerase subunit RPC12/RpoP